MNDMREAQVVEITMDETGKLWVNIDGMCALRVGHVEKLVLDVQGQDNITLEQE